MPDRPIAADRVLSLPASPGVDAPGDRMPEARRLWWRESATERTIRRDGRLWTGWTAWITVVFLAPGALLLLIEPWTFPAAAICFAHAWGIPWLQARRGARQVVPIGMSKAPQQRRGSATPRGRSAASGDGAGGSAERVALGLLGDLVGHPERELLRAAGLALQRGRLGVWLVGEQGAFLVRGRGRRVDCWCVRVAETAGLPAGDRVAHLLLALREDELGFAKVANLGFSGDRRRVARHLPERSRPALEAARRRLRSAAEPPLRGVS